MTRLLTTEIATITELREPQKVLARAKGKPVAILRKSQCVAYLVPAEFFEAEDEPAEAAPVAQTGERAPAPRSTLGGFSKMEAVVAKLRGF